MPVVTLDDLTSRQSERTRVRVRPARDLVDGFLREISRDIDRNLALNSDGVCMFSYNLNVYEIRAHPSENLFTLHVIMQSLRRMPNYKRAAAVDCALELGLLGQRTRGATLLLNDAGDIVMTYEDRPSDIVTQTFRNILENFIDTAIKLKLEISAAMSTARPDPDIDEVPSDPNDSTDVGDEEVSTIIRTLRRMQASLEGSARRTTSSQTSSHGTSSTDRKEQDPQRSKRHEQKTQSSLMVAVGEEDGRELEDGETFPANVDVDRGQSAHDSMNAGSRLGRSSDSLLSASDMPIDPARLVSSILRQGDIIELIPRERRNSGGGS